MKLLIGYTSTEGHTRKIAQYLADRAFDGGHSVELLNVSDAWGLDLGRFDGVVLAASVHVGHYQRAMSDFVAAQAEALDPLPTLFLSVSLAAAGHDAEDWKALDKIAAELTEATGWTPNKTAQIAGAYTPSQYDLFKGFIMRRIVAKKDPTADLDADHEYTDWAALDAVFDGWVAGLPG